MTGLTFSGVSFEQANDQLLINISLEENPVRPVIFMVDFQENPNNFFLIVKDNDGAFVTNALVTVAYTATTTGITTGYTEYYYTTGLTTATGEVELICKRYIENEFTVFKDGYQNYPAIHHKFTPLNDPLHFEVVINKIQSIMMSSSKGALVNINPYNPENNIIS